MKDLLRHLTSLILPVTVIIIIPWLIEPNLTISSGWWFASGLIFILTGLMIIIFTIRMFIRIGNGTLAPWDPTRNLVTQSLYGHVRNPMILGVLTMLIGEAIFFKSAAITYWALLFLLINHIYFIISEEPGLEERFGEEYAEYKENVPRWIPRIKPWSPE